MSEHPVLAIMRPETYRESSVAAAKSVGFKPLFVPVVTLCGMKDEVFDGFVSRVLSNKSDYVIFTSANGIEYTLKNVGKESEKKFIDALKKTNIVAIGPTTKKKLESVGLSSSLVPGEYSSKGLVKELGDSVCGKTIDIPRSFYGSDVLTDGLRGAGADVYETHVYTLNAPDGEEQDELVEAALAGEVDAFAFTSSMMVRNFIDLGEQAGEKEKLIDRVNDAWVGAIGFPTAETLEEYGIVVDVVPEEFTFEALVSAIKKKMDE
ncbi:uroporphyrinogen-III synthase [Methanolapillus millepedarum]|uniref:Tetrapyrrole biosynthesis uroporphyrinogen III synthase domain-containing protein n=1 Tax=Methanolapillus millepedarum TaxID=3028296 RepID=A0AA96V4X8_9EURY|nr:hypothetical protein MsAc7_06230 [Methanosarcinaceae archaeon Ac7]